MEHLPQELTKESKLSKVLAGIAFLTIPFIGFFAGMRYGQFIERLTIIDFVITQEEPENPPNNWQLYTNINYGFSFLYPALNKTCCTIAGPLTGKSIKLVSYVDEKTVTENSDQLVDGIAFYVIPNPGKVPFDEYMEQEKKALLENHIVHDKITPVIGSEVIFVDNTKGTRLIDYAWWSNEMIYLPLKTGGILVIVKSQSSPGSWEKNFRSILKTVRFS